LAGSPSCDRRPYCRRWSASEVRSPFSPTKASVGGAPPAHHRIFPHPFVATANISCPDRSRRHHGPVSAPPPPDRFRAATPDRFRRRHHRTVPPPHTDRFARTTTFPRRHTTRFRAAPPDPFPPRPRTVSAADHRTRFRAAPRTRFRRRTTGPVSAAATTDRFPAPPPDRFRATRTVSAATPGPVSRHTTGPVSAAPPRTRFAAHTDPFPATTPDRFRRHHQPDRFAAPTGPVPRHHTARFRRHHHRPFPPAPHDPVSADHRIECFRAVHYGSSRISTSFSEFRRSDRTVSPSRKRGRGCPHNNMTPCAAVRRIRRVEQSHPKGGVPWKPSAYPLWHVAGIGATQPHLIHAAVVAYSRDGAGKAHRDVQSS